MLLLSPTCELFQNFLILLALLGKQYESWDQRAAICGWDIQEDQPLSYTTMTLQLLTRASGFYSR